jgi:hypothetical protein
MLTNLSSTAIKIRPADQQLLEGRHSEFNRPIFATVKKGKTIFVTGFGGRYGCEKSRLPHFPENRFTDGGEVVRLINVVSASKPKCLEFALPSPARVRDDITITIRPVSLALSFI